MARKRHYRGFSLTVADAEMLHRILKADIEEGERLGCPQEPDDGDELTVGGSKLRIFDALHSVLVEYRTSILATGGIPAFVWDDDESAWGAEGLNWKGWNGGAVPDA